VAPLDATQHRLAVATIVGVYGIKGWVKLRVNLSDPSLLPSLLSPQLDDPSGKTEGPVRVVSVRAQGKGYIAQLVGVDDRNQAEGLRGFIITIPESSLPSPAAGELYWRDLEGCRVESIHGQETVCLGVVDYLLDTGANDVLVVRATADSVDDRERLIPWLEPDVIDRVDLNNQTITVRWHPDD
jgi:16S rRNA processing protein RimM